MLTVTPLSEAIQLAREHFGSLRTSRDFVDLTSALQRVLAEDICSDEFVPVFNRSTADGFAVRSADEIGRASGRERV